MRTAIRMPFAAAAGLAAALSYPSGAADVSLASQPVLPRYGEAVGIQLVNAPWPTYLPATRYSVSGSGIVIDFEYVSDGFGPARPDVGAVPLNLGELAPGNYTVEARLYDIAQPSATPRTISTSVPVLPPESWGLYMVPAQPHAFSDTQVTVKSAVYLDPASMRTSISGNVIRVDFDYLGTAPAWDPAPEGMTTFASARVPGLAPGAYRVEGWGRDMSGGSPEQYFTKEVTVASTVPVVEYYSRILDHYFMAAGADEIELLDRGAQGDWMRTGQRFNAWMRQADALSGAAPVCRFYARGPNSHFYTGSTEECGSLKALEQQQRAEAAAGGQPFLGWGYEGIAFWAMVPMQGQCPANTHPVYRAYNDRAAQMDSNHRFTVDPVQRAAMVGWADEGVHFCSPD